MSKKLLWRFQLVYKDVPQGEQIDVRPIKTDEIDFLNSNSINNEISFSFLSDIDDPDLMWRFISAAVISTDKEIKLGDWGDWGGILTILTAVKTPVEEWHMNRIHPRQIVFSDIDYTSSEVSAIELTIIYNEVKYRSLLPSTLA